MRAAYALRPDGIIWPQEEGRVTLKLERLTAANGIGPAKAAEIKAALEIGRRLVASSPLTLMRDVLESVAPSSAPALRRIPRVEAAYAAAEYTPNRSACRSGYIPAIASPRAYR